jgi:two-component system, NarL family, nitrate/nitrite response regulator NarL
MSSIFFVGNQLSSAGLKGLLADGDFSWIGEARTLSEAHRLLCETPADAGCAQILLLDVQNRLCDEDEEDSLRAVHRDRPTMKIAVISDASSLGFLSQKFPQEIDGYLLTEMSAVALNYSLHLIISGSRIFPSASYTAVPSPLFAVGAPISAQPTSPLSVRELHVLQLLIEGSSNKAIARNLAISDGTVKVHMKSLLRKVNVQNRTQAALWGIEHGVQKLPAAAAPAPQIRYFGSDDRRTSHSFGFASVL